MNPFFPRVSRSVRRRFRVPAGGLLLAAVVACAVNPVTGERQLALMTEAQEIQMGRDADPQITASLGLYDDPEWQQFVQELGERMAADSERPHLPWTFRVLEDPVVNAFAVPGGFIYLTRGILTHFSSEAELAGVLGHEIGHVTARHGVSRMSWAHLAQVGLGLGTILAPPDWAPLADLAGAGMGLLFLSYGRDAERQADDLGLRYMTGEGYDPREMAVTFSMLADASGARDGDRIPGFLSSHPNPLERRTRVLEQIAAGEVSGSRVERESFLRRIDGMVFGPNPRDGYFRDGTFYHPEMAFQFAFPSGWNTLNQRTAVQGVSSEQDAAVILTLEDATSPRAARERFLSTQGISGSGLTDASVNGLTASRAEFTAQTEGGTLRGEVLFLAQGNRIFRILGYAPEAVWSVRASAIRGSLGTFRPVTDAAVLGVQPSRVRLVRTDQSMTVEAFHQRFPSTVPLATIATINHLRPGETIPPGTLMKRVTGG